MNKTLNYMIIVVLSTPIWLFMYTILVPDVVTNTDTVYIENDIDCAECIEICNGGTYEEAIGSMEIIIPLEEEVMPTNDKLERMKQKHPNLWKDMGPKYFSVVHDDPTFEEAFRKARAHLGPGQTFKWNNNLYTTNYKEEVEVLTNQSID